MIHHVTAVGGMIRSTGSDALKDVWIVYVWIVVTSPRYVVTAFDRLITRKSCSRSKVVTVKSFLGFVLTLTTREVT